MKIRLLLISLMLIGVTASAYGQRRVRLHQEFLLRAGQTVFVKGADLKIKFTGLVEDSRCPEGVQCVWAGNGKIALTVRKGRHKSVSFELNTTTEPKSFIYRGYEITLVRLEPYPKKDVPIKKRAYIAKLIVGVHLVESIEQP